MILNPIPALTSLLLPVPVETCRSTDLSYHSLSSVCASVLYHHDPVLLLDPWSSGKTGLTNPLELLFHDAQKVKSPWHSSQGHEHSEILIRILATGSCCPKNCRRLLNHERCRLQAALWEGSTISATISRHRTTSHESLVRRL